MTYRAPIRDIALALKAAGHPALAAAAFPGLDDATVEAVLAAAGEFAQDQLAPLNRVGDLQPARYANGAVTASPGFADAFRAYAAGGWPGLSADPEHGGQGLSKALDVAVMEMVSAANMAFGLCPILSQGAIEALSAQGTERQKRLVLPKLVSGEWTGTMNLTEPQAGSDLAAVTARAEPDGAGGYRITGQKIFITWGDHEMTENICHLVLARMPDAPPGVKGISLFLAPKRLIDDAGNPGAPNALRPASIEHKLGIHGSPTCVMLFEGAKAELVGTANEGLAHMFVMMNAARLQVGVQGVAIAERAFQQALSFAQERRQGRALWASGPDGAIFDHPDVRRTLMLMKAKIAAGRGICLEAAVLADQARFADTPQARADARARQELFTPIAKGWSSDMGVEVASLGLQVHGGMGFIEETGAAQHYRDARIAPIYEGTNGIQAIDLVGRKLGADNGAAMGALIADMAATARELSASAGLAGVGQRLSAGALALEQATAWLLDHRGGDSLAAATPYLRLAGDVAGGWALCRQALACAPGPQAETKAALARLYASQVLAQAPGLAEGVMTGAEDLAATAAAALEG